MRPIVLLLAFLLVPAAAKAEWVSERPSRAAFPIAAEGRAAPILIDRADHKVVALAAADLAGDIERVTGLRPMVVDAREARAGRTVILAGTLGRNPLIDRLAAQGRLDIRKLKGAWESFVIATLRAPAPGIDRALIVVGSDRRGTAFGLYALSEAIGVSPWHWWADVPPQRRASLYVAAGTRRFGPPAVRYRGIFLNDEDWGLQPWAARTHEPERGDIGPKTYGRVFELLLRLKANTLWPAMHRVTAPFNADPTHARLADDHAIVMGSSHAEPMLRNNVGEWTDAPGRFNYAANRAGVRAYWEERVKSNGGYESLWTLGMRGIHDSGIVGADDVPGKIALLNRAIADQRAMLAANAGGDPTGIPQVFTPYKEVLELYRAGLAIPADVTIVWPDDNFGYIRQLPNAAERARPGGSGVYYHLSYLGAPLAYLWLSTTPPALIAEEMIRAWDAGARTVWIANVGDLKPAEIGTSLFLELAWDVEKWRGVGQRRYLEDWAGRTFGKAQAGAIAALLDAHFRINFERRPEHLQYWLPGERPRRSPLSPGEIGARLARFDALTEALDAILAGLPAEQGDAFFQLVEYPVRAAAAANHRAFGADLYARWFESDPARARAAGARARAADETIKALTRRFNEEVAGRKWRHSMAEEPADNLWQGFRMAPIAVPAASLLAPPRAAAAADAIPADPPSACDASIDAGHFASQRGWTWHEGLGRGRGSLVAGSGEARADYVVDLPEGCRLVLALLPTFAGDGEARTRLLVSIDGGAEQPIEIARETGSRAWALGVLDNLLTVKLPEIAPGRRRIRIRSEAAGNALDEILVRPAEPQAVAEH